MIDLFEIDVNKLEQSRYKRFVSKVIDNSKFQEKIEKADKDFQETVSKYIAPKQKKVNLFYYLSMISVFLTLIFALLFVQELGKEQFPTLQLVLLIVSVIAAVVSSFFQYRFKKLLDKAMKSDEVKKATEKNREVEAMLVKELGIPEGTTKVDVFVRQVYQKGENYYNALRQSYANYALYAYSKNEKVYFSDTYEVIEFSLSEVKAVRLFKQKITFDHWNKKEHIRDPKFNEYGIRISARSGLLVNCFYQIEIERNNAMYRLCLPGYEKEFVESIFNKEEIIIEDKKNENKQ